MSSTESGTQQIGLDGETSSIRDETTFRFAVIPKQLNSPFFDAVHVGCLQGARQLGNVECIYTGTPFPDIILQAQLIRDLVSGGDIHGIALSIIQTYSPETNQAIAFAIDNGVPVITFDSDAAESRRLTYVGTNNDHFGEHLGKVLLMIDPTGGQYGIVSTQATNAVIRKQALIDKLKGSKWTQIDESPLDCQENDKIAIRKMERAISLYPQMKAIISVGGWPMRNTTLWTDFVERHPNITTVCADNLPHQMEILDQGSVDGLVGQVPTLMGHRSMEVLRDIAYGNTMPDEIYGTVLQEIINVPLNLDDPVVDENHLGNLQYLGFTCAGIVTMFSIGFAVWTYYHRKAYVVRASQPIFLIMIAVGTLIFGLSMIPMSFDDANSLIATERPVVVACTSQVWLFSIGFITIFSALFSKTWRLKTVWRTRSMESVVVTMKDAMKACIVLISANLLTLTLMTALEPLEFVRYFHDGTDDWNRNVSSYGVCESTSGRSGGEVPYLVTLALINFGALIIALYQAYQARSIQTEYSESHYIAVVITSMLQATIITGPLVVPLRQFPRQGYILKVSLVFTVSVGIQLCIFLPKVLNVNKRNPSSLANGSELDPTGRSQLDQSGP